MSAQYEPYRPSPMIQVMTEEQTESTEFPLNSRCLVRVEGNLEGKTVQLQTRRIDGDVWNFEFRFTEGNKTTIPLGSGSNSIVFRIFSDKPGITAYWTPGP